MDWIKAVCLPEIPPTKLVAFEVGQIQTKQNVPGWSGFQAMVTVNNSRPTRIGFFFNDRYLHLLKNRTQYTYVWKRLNETLRESLHPKNAVVTFDEGIYLKNKRV